MILAPHNMTDDEILDVASLSDDPLVKRMYYMLRDFYNLVDGPGDIDGLVSTVETQESELRSCEGEITELHQTLRDWKDKDLRYLEIERELWGVRDSARYFSTVMEDYRRENAALAEQIKTWTILST